MCLPTQKLDKFCIFKRRGDMVEIITVRDQLNTIPQQFLFFMTCILLVGASRVSLPLLALAGVT